MRDTLTDSSYAWARFIAVIMVLCAVNWGLYYFNRYASSEYVTSQPVTGRVASVEKNIVWLRSEPIVYLDIEDKTVLLHGWDNYPKFVGRDGSDFTANMSYRVSTAGDWFDVSFTDLVYADGGSD